MEVRSDLVCTASQHYVCILPNHLTATESFAYTLHVSGNQKDAHNSEPYHDATVNCYSLACTYKVQHAVSCILYQTMDKSQTTGLQQS